MSLLREVVGAVCCCCVPDNAPSEKDGVKSRNLKRLSDWRAHPTLRQYDLEKHIADGGFSEVWLVRSRSTAEQQCLKVVNLRKPGLLPEDVEILRGEARFLRLLEHPGLLRCRDVFETKYHLVMVLEYLSGGQMLDHLHLVDHYSEGQAVRLFAQVAGAVAYLHNLNIVHRDIKPENVMFARPVDEVVAAGRPLRVKLIDLGMATVLLPPPETPEEAEAARLARKRRRRQADGATTRLPPPRREPPRGCLGSPGFIAPEVVHGDAHTLAMDVYALGVLLFAMLTGRKPWSLRDSRNLSYAEKSILEAPGLKDPIFLSLSRSARELLLAMMADDPRVRPSAAEVLRHPFIKQSLAAAGGSASLIKQPPLDDVIKRRFAQLASLRRFRGLAFAMMSSRQQEARGQALADFTKQLTERRRELHKDLLTRAKTRRSVELNRCTPDLHLQPRGQGQEGPDSAASSAKKPPQYPRPQQAGKRPCAGTTTTTTAIAAAAGSPVEGRLSVDSACSQQPLLRRLQQQPWLQPASQQQRRHRRWSLQMASTASPDCDTSAHATQRDQEEPPHCDKLGQRGQRPQFEASPRRSFDSMLSSASATSRQPLVGFGGGGGGGGGGVPPLLPSHHASHLWAAAGSTGSPAGSPGGTGEPHRALPPPYPHPHPYSRGASHQLPHHQHRHPHQSHHLQQRHALDPVVEPGERSGGSSLPSAAAAPQAPPAPAPATAGAAPGGRNRGWSSSGRPSTVTAPLPPRQRQAGRPRPVLARESELALAAVDPLAVLRELSAVAGGGGGQLLGRAHSAPESLAASLAVFSSGGGGGVDGGAGGRGRASRAGNGGTAAAMDVWLDRMALGADMRAASANSWTLDMLENADLLLALTGLPLGRQASSVATQDPSVHSGSTPYPVRPSTSSLAAAATSAAVMLQRLRSDAAYALQPSPATPQEHQQVLSPVSSHQRLAQALLAAARAGGSAHCGNAVTTAGHSAVAVVDAARRRPGSRDCWPPHSVFAAASALAAVAAAAAADTPTRSVAAAGGGGLQHPYANWSPFTALSQSGMALIEPGSSRGCSWAGAPPRALFVGGVTPPMRPSLDGLARPLPPLPMSSPLLSGNTRPLRGEFGYGSGAAAAGIRPEEPMPLLRSVRYDEGGASGRLEGLDVPVCDVPYTSLHLSASSRQLGVALPMASASPAAAAAAATVAVAEPGWPSALASAALAAQEVTPVRRSSLALVDVDEQIAARKAFLEESLHGGTAWFRMGLGAGVRVSPAAAGAAAAAALAAAAAAADRRKSFSDVSGHRRPSTSGGLSRLHSLGTVASSAATALAAAPPGLSLLHHQLPELATQGAAVGSGTPGPHVAAASLPHLARITECSDLGDTPSLPETWTSARALAACGAPAPAPPAPGLPPPVAAPGPEDHPGFGGSSADAATAVVVVDGVSASMCSGAGPQLEGRVGSVAGAGAAGAAARPAAVRWRSPFEPLAGAPAGPEEA